ncbi:MAG: DUF5658 family protein [Bacillota bacterium]
MISLKLMLIAIGVFNIADYVVTMQAVRDGFTEGNPLMQSILFTPWFAAIKLLLIPSCLLAIWLVEDRLRPFGRKVVLVGLLAYAGLMVYHGREVVPHLLW